MDIICPNFRSSRIPFGIAALVFILSCAHVRTVKVQPGEGGEIAVFPQNDLEARGKAQTLMADNCRPKKFKIVEEGEVVTGQSTQQQAQVNPNKYTGGATASGSTYTTNTTEWRIKYRCVEN